MKKTILITGSTDGIGKLTAIKLARDGHEVYLHGRSADKIQDSIEAVKQASDNDQIKGVVADLSDFSAVVRVAAEIGSAVEKLDILINNAGVYHSPRPVNANGLDMRMVVNYLSPVLLTNLLMPLLKKAIQPRVINLSSAAQQRILPGLLDGEVSVPVNSSYAQSKLALTMWSSYLANKESDVAVIAVNPGSLLDTKMVKEAFGQSWSSADKGADILYELSVADTPSNRSGNYFDNDSGQFTRAHSDAYDPVKIKQLIGKTEQILSAVSSQ